VESRRVRLRSVELPFTGRLYLYSMPGRFEPFALASHAIQSSGITWVVCLTPLAEVQEKAPAYARAIETGTLPWLHVSCPIPDFGVPEQLQAFVATAADAAQRIRAGQNILVHCAAGIGRTGTFAMAVCLQLGFDLQQASETVQAAGSSPDTNAQAMLVAGLAH
jgi:hypothetical protein